MGLGLYHYQLLCNVLESIHFIYDEDTLANTILTNISPALNAEGGSIFKILETGAIVPLASYGAPLEQLKKMEFSYGKGVVGWVAQYAQPVKVDKPAQDQRFMGTIDNSTGFVTRSILAAPILAKGKAVGVLEFLNKKDGAFAVPDLELISMVGREVGIAFENMNLIRSLERANAFQEAIINSLSSGVLVLDTSGNLLKMNPRAKNILMIEYDPPDGKPLPSSRALSIYPQLLSALKQAMASPEPVLRQEFHLSIAGQDRLIGYSGVPIEEKSKRVGFVFLFQDITEFAKK